MLSLVAEIVAFIVCVVASAAFIASPTGVDLPSQTREDNAQTPVNPQGIKKVIGIIDISQKVLDSLLSSAAPALNAECFSTISSSFGSN